MPTVGTTCKLSPEDYEKFAYFNPKLTSLSVQDLPVSARQLAAYFPNLTALALETSMPEDFRSLAKLESLSVKVTRLDGTPFPVRHLPPSLRTLKVKYCDLDAEELPAGLASLDLTDCWFAWKNLGTLTQLTSLTLYTTLLAKGPNGQGVIRTAFAPYHPQPEPFLLWPVLRANPGLRVLHTNCPFREEEFASLPIRLTSLWYEESPKQAATMSLSHLPELKELSVVSAKTLKGDHLPPSLRRLALKECQVKWDTLGRFPLTLLQVDRGNPFDFAAVNPALVSLLVTQDNTRGTTDHIKNALPNMPSLVNFRCCTYNGEADLDQALFFAHPTLKHAETQRQGGHRMIWKRRPPEEDVDASDAGSSSSSSFAAQSSARFIPPPPPDEPLPSFTSSSSSSSSSSSTHSNESESGSGAD